MFELILAFAAGVATAVLVPKVYHFAAALIGLARIYLARKK